MDRGANGCILGKDVRVVHHTGQFIDLNGIDNHTVRHLQLVTGAAHILTDHGPIIGLFHQSALMTDGKTILSPGQLEHFGCQVYDKPSIVLGKDPFFVTPNGFRVPMAVSSGLPYVQLRPPTDQELHDSQIPHIDLTSPHPWDPKCLDSVPADGWYKAQDNTILDDGEFPLDSMGKLRDYEDDIDLDLSDRQHKSMDRPDTIAYLASVISDELTPGRSCMVQTRAQRQRHRPPTPPSLGSQDSPSLSGDGEDIEPRSPSGESNQDLHTRSTDDVSPKSMLTSNNKAKHATGIIPPPKSRRLKLPPISKLRRYFPGVKDQSIERTLQATTQFGTKGATIGRTLRGQITSPNPILNIPRRQEDVATDTVYSNTPAINDGSTAAQFFIGRTSHYRSMVPSGNSDASFVRTLMDEIRRRGAMNTLVSDNAKAQISQRAKDILRQLCIKDRQSEPYRGNQNFAELGWRDTKAKIKVLLDSRNAPSDCWLLAGQYVCFLQNHIAYESLGWRTPWEWVYGHTPDISALLQFEFYEPVYYQHYGSEFPSDSSESIGRFVGIAENVGHSMTYKILTANGTVIHRAVARTARKGHDFTNWKANKAAPHIAPKTKQVRGDIPLSLIDKASLEGQPDSPFYESIREDILHSLQEEDVIEGGPMPTVDVKGLLNRTFISNPDEEGVQVRAKVVSAQPTMQTDADGTDAVYRFKCKHGDQFFEEVLSYNKMLEWCDRDLDKDDMYRIESIASHRKSRTKSKFEVLVRWASGEVTWEDMGTIFNDDPVSISIYALKNNLLKVDGWKRCRTYAKNTKVLARMIHQANLKNFRNKPVYQYGFQVPRNHAEAVFIDEKNGNTKWQDAEKLEISQLMEYQAFSSLGKNAPVPSGHQKIVCHMVYAVKHDGRHKCRFVAGGHMTETPLDPTYSGVVSLQGIRIVTFLAELNETELWSTDVGNAYLESYTKEKICFTAGAEFGELAGHTMLIVRALYGLKGSGKSWHDKLFDVLTDFGFSPSKAEPDIWMRGQGDHYEYVASYVDDLLISSKNPQAIIDMLQAPPNNFKLKGTGPTTFHLGCDFIREKDGTLSMTPKKYIDRVKAQYVTLFGENPSTKVTSPLEKNDHPELDTSPLLGAHGINQYQSLIGALQWAISLGRFDIASAVMSLSSFRVAPRQGHLDRLKRVTGFLVKMNQAAIRVRTEVPDYSQLTHRTYDWTRTVYGDVTEEFPPDAPKPKGKPVVLTTYVDANLYHDWVTGKAVTGILHFVNQTPIEWYCKKQPTVEAATYGSEFVAAKIATQQAIAARLTFRYLGVDVQGPTYLFGDNGSVVTSSTQPHSPLKKRHHALAYHFVREAVAARIISFHHIPGERNPADILTKHWGYSQIWPMLRAVLFWQGDTAKLLDPAIDDTNGGER